MPLVGLVHVGNVVTWTRALVPTDVLDLRVTATAVRPHRLGRVVDLVSEVMVDGEAVWTGVSTYLARGRATPRRRRPSHPTRATSSAAPVG